MRFHIVDVFAEAKYSGNQLAVVTDAGSLSPDEMQRIAREMNFSETAFVLSREPREGGYDVRIFTPSTEVPFAGHPTLGTAFVVQQEIAERPREKIVLNLEIGQILVRFARAPDGAEVLWMYQKAPEFGDTIERKTIGRVLGLEPGDLDDRFPAQEVSTGLPFVIVPLKTLEAVQRARVAEEHYAELTRSRSAKALYFFCSQVCEPANQLHARMFADYYGVPEDPATGSAAGCLAGYLVLHRYFDRDEIEVRVEQGYEMGRPSLLRIRGEKMNSGIEVFVGGKVVPVACGELL